MFVRLGSRSSNRHSEVYYLQSQNGNVYCSDGSRVSEFEGLQSDIPEDLKWCSEALGMSNDKVDQHHVSHRDRFDARCREFVDW